MRNDLAIRAGWLKKDETPLFPRLEYPLAEEHPDCIFDENIETRDELLSILLSNEIRPVPNPPLFDPHDQEIVISHVDRYNLPLRTVLSSRSGLMRSDPYYPNRFLRRFYADFYRNIYRGRKHSPEKFLADQVTHGQRILWRTRQHVPQRKLNVLDVGCGMGGALIAFHWHGHHTVGCDYGEEYAAKGRALGMDIRIGGLEAVASAAPFDLIICSHVLEHAVDPIGFAESTAALLSNRGVMYIEVPGIMYIEKFWSADVLRYLQNAHAWHFTANTLAAVLSRAGLEVQHVDESIWCVAKPNENLAVLPATDGELVLNELNRLESALTKSRVAA